MITLNLADDEDFAAGIDEAQAKKLLRQDAMIAERAVLRLINVPLTDGQFDALVSFTYNLGGGAAPACSGKLGLRLFLVPFHH